MRRSDLLDVLLRRFDGRIERVVPEESEQFHVVASVPAHVARFWNFGRRSWHCLLWKMARQGRPRWIRTISTLATLWSRRTWRHTQFSCEFAMTRGLTKREQEKRDERLLVCSAAEVEVVVAVRRPIPTLNHANMPSWLSCCCCCCDGIEVNGSVTYVLRTVRWHGSVSWREEKSSANR